MASLRIAIWSSSPQSVVRTLEITKECTIGREGTDILLPDPHCSRKHATLSPSGDGILVTDLGSRNGLIVDRRRVNSVLLRPGEIVRIGDTSLQLLSRSDTAVAHDWPKKWRCLPPNVQKDFESHFGAK